MSPTPNPPDNNSRILRQTEELSSSNHVVVHFEDVDDHQNINNNDGDDDLFDSSLDSSKSTSLIDIEEVVTMRGMKKQFKDMLNMATPISLGYLLQMSLGVASIITLGHLGTRELAACALATMYANVTGLSLGIGMASGLDTLCAQAHTGSNDPHALGKHLQRGYVVMLFLTFPVFAFWFYAETILIFAGQDPAIASLAGTYLLYLLPGVIPYFIYECLKRFLQAQGIMSGILFSILLASPINGFLQWFFVHGPLHLGFIGSPIALSITYTLMPIFFYIYISWFVGWDCWGGWSAKDAFDWGQMKILLSLGLPGLFMICSEWWAFEILALAAGWLGEKALAAQSILLQTSSLSYMIPLGVGIAASTRIGNAIGAQCPNLARTATYSSLLLGFAIACTSSSFFIIVRDVWGMLWTEDETVVKLIGTVMPLAAFYQLADGLNCICGGIFRGVGHQKVGAVINLTGFYVIGIPVGMILAFKYGMGLLGLWVGISVGLVVQSLFELGWISQIKWPLESENARKRLMVRRASEAVVASSSSSCLGECGSFGRSISETARLLNEEDEGTNGSHGYGTLEKDRVGSPSYSSDGTVRGGDEETI